MSNFHRVSRFGLVNAYLVEEDDGLTLIDTAVTGSAKAILSAAADVGRPVKRIVLTHAHSDHTGSLDRLAKDLSGVEVLISSRDARLMCGDKSLLPGEPQDKIKGGFPKITTEPTGFIEAGERVGSLEAIAAPGHTPGQLAFLDTRDGTLFCADAYATLGGVWTSAKPTFRYPLPSIATWHRPTALQSARDLRALDPKALAPGHGKVVENPGPAMDKAIAGAE
jgi:glyoxylase-like metal-dependent hydrolase (beta-lactamase superfamily II)